MIVMFDKKNGNSRAVIMHAIVDWHHHRRLRSSPCMHVLKAFGETSVDAGMTVCDEVEATTDGDLHDEGIGETTVDAGMTVCDDAEATTDGDLPDEGTGETTGDASMTGCDEGSITTDGETADEGSGETTDGVG